jgi:hypothetical protein
MTITLYTQTTPNGAKASIALEELKAIGAIPGCALSLLILKWS